MEDKIYVLSDGRVRRVPAGEEEALQAELKEKGLLIKEEKYIHNVAF